MNLTRRASVRTALLVFAVLTGVLGMHGLPAHGALPASPATGMAGMPGMAHTGQHGDHPQPPGKPHDRGPSCESAWPGGVVPGQHAASAVTWPLPQAPEVLAGTTQAQVGEGGGRSPPSHVTLCVFRI